MLKSLSLFVKKWRASRRGGRQLLELLSHVEVNAPLGARNHWLIELVRWVRRGGLPEDGPDGRIVHPQHVRLRYLLRTLDAHPDWKRDVATLLRRTFAELDAISLLCDTGMPTRSGFAGALLERLQETLIPPPPTTTSWSSVVTLMFADGDDSRDDDAAAWIEALPPGLLAEIDALFRFDPAPEAERDRESNGFAQAILAAMHNLCYQIGSTGLSPEVRSRLSDVRIRSLPFYRLGPAMLAVEAAHDAYAAHVTVADAAPKTAPALPRLAQEVNVLRALLDDCHRAIRELYEHLDANGVSVEVVFQVERMRERLVRMERLLNAWMAVDHPAEQARLTADLVRVSRARHSVGHLLRVNSAMLARKMTESCAQTGDGYIARDRRQYGRMLWMAGGGGAITAITVYIKFFITGAHWQPMIEGFLAGLNYAVSFVLMHFLHFTLATKQPAMTAPAIARRLENAGTPDGLDAFAADVVALMRTQAAAVFGNLALVFPLCYLVQWGWFHMTGGNLISPEKARATIASFSLFGATPIWAALTGMLLWASGLIAGWAENWFALHRMEDVLAYNRRLRFVLGVSGAARVAHFWRRNFSGIASNVALGMMLGLVPAVLTAFALPFEVRHVTLSTGSVAVAIGVLGASAFDGLAIWWCVAGIAVMAVLNVTVSFFLAFQMALRSRTALPVDRAQIYKSIGKRLAAHPAELFFPAVRAAAPAP